jgi:predicted nucleic acid-binding protein
MSLVMLDTSAVLAHFFQESGFGIVQQLLTDHEKRTSICAITLFEFRFVLREKKVKEADIIEAEQMYKDLIPDVFAVDLKAVQQAVTAREAAAVRIPMTDALVAGCAICNSATLVHRDKHLDAIPQTLLRSIRLG